MLWTELCVWCVLNNVLTAVGSGGACVCVCVCVRVCACVLNSVHVCMDCTVRVCARGVLKKSQGQVGILISTNLVVVLTNLRRKADTKLNLKNY